MKKAHRKSCHYSLTSPYYDLMYSNKSYKQESLTIKSQVIKHFLRDDVVILDVGCGTGSHMAELSKTFANIEGLDINQKLLKLASNKNPGKKFHLRNMQSFHLRKKFDVILSLFSTISYNKSYSQLKKTMKNFYKNLRPNGMLIFDMTPEEKARKEARGKVENNSFVFEGYNNPRKTTTEYSFKVKIKGRVYTETEILGLFNKSKVIGILGRIGFRVKYLKEFGGRRRDFFVCYKPKEEFGYAYENATNSIVISLTNRCNFNCSYCFQDSKAGKCGKEISKEQVVNVLDFFSKGKKSYFVQFTGGEVLLRKDFFELVSHALSKGYSVRFCTNGKLLRKLTKEQLAMLSSKRVFIKVSLDGGEKGVHEKSRDKRSFEDIRKGIRILRKNTKNIGIKTVVTNGNIKHIEDILKLCLELNVGSFTYNMLRQQGRGAKKENLRVNDYEIFSEILKILHNNKKYTKLVMSSDFAAIVASYFLESFYFFNRFYFFVNANGKVYGNQNLQKKDFIIGDINTSYSLSSSKLNALKSRIIREYEKPCSDCKLKAYCDNRRFREFYEGFGSCKGLANIIALIEKESPNKIFASIVNCYQQNSC